MARNIGNWFVLMAPLLLGGCVGYDRATSFTSDNLGLNLSTAPTPTIAISYSRQEGAMEPVFGNGTTPAIAASVKHTGSLFSIEDKVASIFAGGNAAVSAAGEIPANGLTAVACVEVPSNGDGHSNGGGHSKSILQDGAVAPLVFGTDTAIGLHVTFPTGALQPEIVSATLGYKRFEMAVAPLLSSSDGCTNKQLLDLAMAKKANADAVVEFDKHDTKKTPDLKAADIEAAELARLQVTEATDKISKKPDDYAVYVPSTLAIANDDTGATAGPPANTATLSISQVFATGKAAEVIASGSAFGSIGSVTAAAVAAKTTVASGPVFNVSETALPALNDQVSISLKLAINKDSIYTIPFSYPCSPTETAPTIASGLAAAISNNKLLQAFGVTAKATGPQVAVTVPSNLGFLSGLLSWTSGNSKSGHVIVTPAQPAT